MFSYGYAAPATSYSSASTGAGYASPSSGYNAPAAGYSARSAYGDDEDEVSAECYCRGLSIWVTRRPGPLDCVLLN